MLGNDPIVLIDAKTRSILHAPVGGGVSAGSGFEEICGNFKNMSGLAVFFLVSYSIGPAGTPAATRRPERQCFQFSAYSH
jgi:hypothetical protein